MAARHATALGASSSSLRIPWWLSRSAVGVRPPCGPAALPSPRPIFTALSSCKTRPLAIPSWNNSAHSAVLYGPTEHTGTPFALRGICTSAGLFAKKARTASRVPKARSRHDRPEANAASQGSAGEPADAKTGDVPQDTIKGPAEASEASPPEATADPSEGSSQQQPARPPPEATEQSSESAPEHAEPSVDQTHHKTINLTAVRVPGRNRRTRAAPGSEGDKMVLMDKDGLLEAASLYEGKDWRSDVNLKRLFLFGCTVALAVMVWAAQRSAAYSQHLADLSAASSRLSLAAVAIWRRLSSSDYSEAGPSRAALERVMRTEIADKFGKAYRALMSSWLVFVAPESIQERLSSTFLGISDWYTNLPASKLAAFWLVAANSVVFAMWRIPSPAVNALMLRHFTDQTNSTRFWTLINSSFSHRSLPHFAFNNLALWSIGSASLDAVTNQGSGHHLPEVDPTYKLLAFWVFAALLSCSYSRWSRLMQIRLLMKGGRMTETLKRSFKAADPKRWTELRRGYYNLHGDRASLGASGVVYGLFAVAALSLPEARIGLPFAPAEFSLPLYLGFGAMCAFDLAMILNRRLYLDHFGHLAGAAAGLLWYFVGARQYEAMRLRACASLSRDGGASASAAQS